VVFLSAELEILEFPRKAVVETKDCPITLFVMDATHEIENALSFLWDPQLLCLFKNCASFCGNSSWIRY
jgi:hypothetical protein